MSLKHRLAARLRSRIRPAPPTTPRRVAQQRQVVVEALDASAKNVNYSLDPLVPTLKKDTVAQSELQARGTRSLSGSMTVSPPRPVAYC
jgi:hypothetical protein